MARIVCIADTHLQHEFELPDGDILVHAGDLTFEGNVPEVAAAAAWLGKLVPRYKRIVVIAGNHDWLFQRDPATARLLLEEKRITYLHDQAVELDGLKFWGAPWCPEFMGWAFNLRRGEELARVWSHIPDDTQVLVTHGPPLGWLDDVRRHEQDNYGEYGVENSPVTTEHVGCADLRARVEALKHLRLHVFGHIHRPGLEYDRTGRRFCNASVVNHNYEYRYPPQVIDL